MRTMLLAAAALLLVTPTRLPSQASPYQLRDVKVGAFDRVEVFGPFKVAILANAGAPKVQFFGPPAMLADAVAKVEGHTLTIGFREGAAWSWDPGAGVNIVVSAPSIVATSAAGAAQVEVAGVRGANFSAATNGAASIHLRDLDVGSVSFASGGSSGITAEGTARKGVYAVGGPGSIDAKRLRVQNASLAIGGNGSIFADVSHSAEVAVGGNGRADVVGGAICVRKPASSPNIECR